VEVSGVEVRVSVGRHVGEGIWAESGAGVDWEWAGSVGKFIWAGVGAGVVADRAGDGLLLDEAVYSMGWSSEG
jgi:hypothetical protein